MRNVKLAVVMMLSMLMLCTTTSLVSAQQPANPENAPTLAQALFEEALGLIKDGKISEACPKLAESHRLDPAGGTVLNLAICLEKEGKTASAYLAYDEVLARAVKDSNREREASARERLAYLKPLLSKVVVHVSPKMIGAEALDVRFDGASVRPEAWGIRVPVDPGAHVLTASAAGYADFKTEVIIDEPGKVYDLEVPQLKVGAPRPKKKPDTSAADRRTTIGYVLIGSGAALAVAGVISGALALNKHAESDRNCLGGPNSCTPAGVRAEESADRFAWGANIGLGVGLLAAGIGTVLLLTTNPQTPQSKPTTARLLNPTSVAISF
jgi:hypothetical protein